MSTPDLDINQLTETQQLALQQFTSVTDQEPGDAIPLLRRSEWNVTACKGPTLCYVPMLTNGQIAISKFFDGEAADPIVEARAAQQIPPPRAPRHENLQQSLLHGNNQSSTGHDPAPRIVPQPDDQVARQPPFIVGIFLTPFTLLYKLFSTFFGLFSFVFRFLPQSLRPNTTSGTTRRSYTTGRRALKPRDSAARFKREIEEEFGENTLPFYEGGYAQALDVAKKDLKFLVIILTSPEHDDTSSWIREVLLCSEVQSFLNNTTHELLLWAGDVRDSEAYQVSNALRCSKFPFTALIAHTPQQSTTSMSVLTRITGPMPATAYIAKLQAAITSHAEQLRTVRETRNAQNFERSLREEQNSAYERSLAQDRERARVKKEAEARSAEQERKEQEVKSAALELKQNQIEWRRWRASLVAPEPGPEEKDVVRIGLKMPDGPRITRKFPMSATLEDLYAFVDCYDYLEQSKGVVGCPEGYDHLYQFRLVSIFPRVVYNPEQVGTIAELVGKSGSLVVEPILEDDDDE